MSLFEDKKQTPLPVPKENIQPKEPSLIESPVYRGITIDTEYVPSSALLTWIEGYKWRLVSYFSQVLDASNEPTPQDLHREPAYQQYIRIRDLDIKVNDPLSFSQNPQVRTFEVTGSGFTYPFLVPNKGDMFIADVGDGTAGVFTVTSAQRLTILKDSVYAISYIMVDHLTAERLADLESKTIKEYYYSEDALCRSCGPFVTQTEFDRKSRYQKLRGDIVNQYLSDFYSYQQHTLLVPDQFLPTYDHFVVETLLKMVSDKDDSRIRKVRPMNVNLEPVMKQPTVWDAILRREGNRLSGSTQKTHSVTTRHFRGRPTLQALGYTGIERVIFPQDNPTHIDAYYDGRSTRNMSGHRLTEGKPRKPVPGEPLSQAERNSIYFQVVPSDVDIEPWKRPPDIHPVVKDDHYVFTEAFYNKDMTQMSKLEMLTWQLLNSETLHYEQLERVLETLWSWDNLERFYYHPVVWALLKVAERG